MSTDKEQNCIEKEFFLRIPDIDGGEIRLARLTQKDAPALRELTENRIVYRYLPTFLFEKKYEDPAEVIDRLYEECLQESLIFGIFKKGEFCGLAEMYGYREPIHKISIGYRLLKRCWGQGIASETVKLMVEYLYTKTDVQIITASTMIENQASARVLKKNGFDLVVHAAEEDWGFDTPTIADKWIR